MIVVSLEYDTISKKKYGERKMFHDFFTAFLDIHEQNTSYGCLNLSLYIFIRKIISGAFRFLLIFHFSCNGVSLLSFWLNRYHCRQAFWNLLTPSSVLLTNTKVYFFLCIWWSHSWLHVKIGKCSNSGSKSDLFCCHSVAFSW